MITKSQRYRESLAVLARRGIGVIDDEFIKNEAGEQARAEHLRRACEVTGAYVLNLPWRPARLEPFVLMGAGIMQFNPISAGASVSGTQSQTKPAVLWGAGVNYDLSRHFALRLQYRGLFYAGPDFQVASLKTDRWQPMSQPSFGIVYRF